MSDNILDRIFRTKREEVLTDWLGDARVIGITAGASTPNNKIGETIVAIARTAGLEAELRAALERPT